MHFKDLEETKTNIEEVMEFVLEFCLQRQLRHRGDVVYREIMVDSCGTHAWLPAKYEEDSGYVDDLSSIKKLMSYVMTRSRSEGKFAAWLNTSTRALEEKLQMSREAEFQLLKASRGHVSFRDGIYSLIFDTFTPYSDAGFFRLSRDVANLTFHDVNFSPAFWHPTDDRPKLHPLLELRTPLFDKIMDAQHLDGHTVFWILAMMGRCMFWAGQLESWQVVPYIRGRAGNGKSTLITLMASMVGESNTVAISNNVEGTFGL
ncbi:unnamed protein product, partial [Chrysoparadoxa australica]